MDSNMKKKVLFVMENFKSGGIESFFFNVYNNIDLDKFKIDLAVNTLDFSSPFYSIIREKGINVFIYGFSSKSNSIYFSLWKIFKIIKENGEYDVVHSNVGFANAIVLFIAKFLKINKRFSHSHTSLGVYKNINIILKKVKYVIRSILFRHLILKFSTKCLAVSNKAVKYLYGNINNYQIIKNGIDTVKFKYNQQIRNKFREKLNIENKFIVGHVGRFTSPKNHLFLIDIFNEINTRNKNSMLMLIGEGQLKKNVKQKIEKLKLRNSVVFIGTKNNVNDYYQATDVFILPSLVEGLGIVAIEAQCSGLPCFISDGVPDEAMICNTTKISLSKSAKEWADIILGKIKNFERKDCSKLVKDAGFDIKDTAKQIEQIYLEG